MEGDMSHLDREQAARLREKADEFENAVNKKSAPRRLLQQFVLKIPGFRRLADAYERRDAERP
jgi:hypothetical protein